MSEYKISDLVEVYCKYCPWRVNDKYMVASTIVCGTQSPRIARSDGWAKAVIVETAEKNPLLAILPPGRDPESPGVWVRIKFLDPVWVDSKGQVLEEKSLFQWLSAKSGNIRLLNPSPIPEVSMVVFRWGGSVPVDERRFDFALSDKLIQECLDCVHAKVPNNLEIFTVHIQHTSDLRKVSHHHIWQSLRGKLKFGMYFLWGSSSDSKPGYVLANDFIDLMERFESVGIVTKYPNHAQMYRAITSKEYQAALSSCSPLRIPATVSVPVSYILSNLENTVQKIFRSLQTIKKDTQKCDSPIVNGLVKVGYEWMGDGVRAFSGSEDLKAKILSILDGGHGVVKSVLVQERVNSLICEPRVFVFNGIVAGIRYTWNEKEDAKSGRIHALRTCRKERAAEELFQGDIGAQKYVERKIAQLVKDWNVWLLSVGGEVPLFVRIDFLVEKIGGQCKADVGEADTGEDEWNSEEAEEEELKSDPVLPSPEHHVDDSKYDEIYRVWTCELGEMGSSMVGFREGKRMLFDAVATSCVPVCKRPVRAAPRLS